MNFIENFNSVPGIGQDRQEWLEYMQFLWDLKPKTYVEIGTYIGGTIASVKRLLPDCRCITIDVADPKKIYDVSDDYLKGVEFVKGDSADKRTINTIKSKLNGKRADVLFIDGDHKLDACLADWNNYYLMADNVAIHDIKMTAHMRGGGVETPWLWKTLRQRYDPYCKIIEIRNDYSIIGGIGIIQKKGVNNL